MSACSTQSGQATIPPSYTSQAQPAQTSQPQRASTFAQAQAAAASKRTANQSVPNVFEQARGLNLSPSDFDVYIDPSVQGADRQLAEQLLAYMPANQRGDFVYFDANGRLVSNNPALLKYVSVSQTKRAATTQTMQSNARGIVRPMDYSSPCSPPNPPEVTGGAYVRQVSQCGFTAGDAFVNVPCGYSSFQTGDVGFLYY